MLSADQELVMLSRIVKPADARSFLAIAIVVPSLMLFTIFNYYFSGAVERWLKDFEIVMYESILQQVCSLHSCSLCILF
jgi:hypothetical protein